MALPFYTVVDSMLGQLQTAQRAVMCMYTLIDRLVQTSIAQPQGKGMAAEMLNGIVFLVSYTCMSS